MYVRTRTWYKYRWYLLRRSVTASIHDAGLYSIIGFFLQLQYRPNRFVDILLILQHAWNIMVNQDFRLASTDLPVIWGHLEHVLILASAHDHALCLHLYFVLHLPTALRQLNHRWLLQSNSHQHLSHSPRHLLARVSLAKRPRHKLQSMICENFKCLV